MHAIITNSSDSDPLLGIHIIRYHTSWFEDGRLFMQTEFCPSSLPDVVADTGGPLPEPTVLAMLRDVASGLKFLHSHNLVHLDIKPANIFVASSGLFKIGDLGLVSPAGEPAEVTSGDARYLPREILLNNFRHLPKADVFSLGATALECMLAQRLEAEGEDWHRLRDGQFPLEELGGYSSKLITLVMAMMAPDPEQRPTAEAVLETEIVRTLPKLQLVRDAGSKTSPSKSIIQSLKHTRQKLRKLFTTT